MGAHQSWAWAWAWAQEKIFKRAPMGILEKIS
jgi:hypothetical protein